MNTRRRRQIKHLFERALERDSAEPALLQNETGDGEAGLNEEREPLLTAVAHDHAEGPVSGPGSEPPLADEDQYIGPYKVLREIGTGGLGTVYRAVRADQEFQKRVAVKLIRRGMASDELVRRFRMERQILANLEHPNIARLLDGGSTAEGLPYLVMECVDGESLDHYCDARRLSIKDRLRLFRQVCSAVQFAHQNLVVHRDLKPGNILVTADGPKLLDFGIAKLLRQEATSHGDLTRGATPMTPEYASPEQARGDAVTTRSDVYSLGVILYELMTGHPPYRLDGCDPLERARRICEHEPLKPSSAVGRREEIPTSRGTLHLTPESVSRTREGNPRKLQRCLAGDIDHIVRKALRKEPGERYSSVEQFSEDIRRHLERLPVQAREGALLYRGAKFLRRNRWRLAACLAVLLVSAAGVAMKVQSQRQVAQAELVERLAAERIEEANRQAEIRSELLRNLFLASDFHRDESLSVREVFDRGTRRIRQNLQGEPLATQMEILGLLYDELGLHAEARELLWDTLKLRQSLYDGDHPLLARGLNNMAAWYYHAGKYEKAGELYQEALDMRLRLGQEGVYLDTAMSNLASILMNRGAYGRAEELYRRALAIRREAYGAEDATVATSLRSLGILLYLQGDFEGAEPLLREALENRRRNFGAQDTRVAAAQSSLARVLAARGQYREARRLLGTALATRQRLLGERHPHVALTKKDLAAVLLAEKRTDAEMATAEALLSEALQVLRQSKAEGSWEIADAESLWGALLIEQGRYAEAEPFLVESYHSLKELRGADAIYTRWARDRLVALYATWGKPLPVWSRADVSSAARD